jgi:hypothetical protein
VMKLNRVFVLIAVSFLGIAAGCGGGSTGSSNSGSNGSGRSGGTPSANNVATLTVDQGPAALLATGQADEDIAFITVTVCVPGTATCQNIDHVQVDTGSEGLRIASGVLTQVSLQTQMSGTNPVSECAQFGDLTYLWGKVATADIQIAGEVAKNVPIQIADSSAAPSTCSSGETGQLVTAADIGANGILGVGLFRQDCGFGCTQNAPPAFYYSCNNGACSSISEPLTAQLQNPVWMFPTDNNGVILQLPSVPDVGQATVTNGQLIFGIGTQSNNGLGSAVALPVDQHTGNFAAQFAGVTYNDFNGAGSGGGSSFIDSGSNGYFFLDSKTLVNSGFPISDCPSSANLQGFYCPSPTQPISVTAIGDDSSGIPTGPTRTINFNVADAQTLFQTGFSAFNNVGGDNSNSFDFGLPFIFGKSVFFVIEGQTTPAGTGPLYAF